MRRRILPAVLLALALAVSGCGQDQQANDNGPDVNPVQPDNVIRSAAPAAS